MAFWNEPFGLTGPSVSHLVCGGTLIEMCVRMESLVTPFR